MEILRAKASGLAVFWVPEAYSLGRDVIMGRQAAGAGFIQSLASTQPDQLYCYAQSLSDAEDFKQVIARYGGTSTTLHWIPFLRPKGLHTPGMLYRPDANIVSDAWRRAGHAGDRAYSLCGVTHTTATHAVMENVAALLTSPLHSWDALVCTSHAVRDSVRSILESMGEHLKRHNGATRLTMPQTPLIPLGVDTRAFDFAADERRDARAAIGIEDHDVVVSFIGRLSFHTKAHHLPMYLALEKAARGSNVVLLQAGWFQSSDIEAAFRDEAQQFCPSIRCIFLDGRDAVARRRAWAASDIFTSLSDNFQETFGLSPIEAMACGIPSVVSDWNGYRDTIRDGLDGFRIPTLSMPAGTGEDLADRYDWGIDNYDFYMFHGSQLVSVDIDLAATAYRDLIESADLRRRMGAAARLRAREHFDWAVIMKRYFALWEELAERRRADPAFYAEDLPRRRPDRADPFSMFASYPSSAIGASTLFRRAEGSRLEHAIARRNLNSIGKAAAVLPSMDLMTVILKIVGEDWIDLEKIEDSIAGYEPYLVARALIWLTKVGVLASRRPPIDPD